MVEADLQFYSEGKAKLNIAQTTITYPPALGGLDRYRKETSEGLVRSGHKVVVVTTDLEQPLSRKRLSIPPGYVDVAEVHPSSSQRRKCGKPENSDVDAIRAPLQF